METAVETVSTKYSAECVKATVQSQRCWHLHGPHCVGCIYKYANRCSSGIINIFKTANVAECAFSSFYTWSFQHKSSVPFELCEDQCYLETQLLTDRQHRLDPWGEWQTDGWVDGRAEGWNKNQVLSKERRRRWRRRLWKFISRFCTLEVKL